MILSDNVRNGEIVVGNFPGNLEHLAIIFSSDFPEIMVRKSNSYMLRREEDDKAYLLLISRRDPGPLPFNLMVTVLGSDPSRIKELISSVMENSPVKLSPAPSYVKACSEEFYQAISRYLSASDN